MPIDPNDPILLSVIAVNHGQLDALERSVQRRLLRIYERERDALLHRIVRMGTEDTFSSRHLHTILVAVREAIGHLRSDLVAEQSSAVMRSADLGAHSAIREVSRLEGLFGSLADAKAVASLSAVIPHRAVAKVDDLVALETENLTVNFDQSTRAILQHGLIQGRNSRQLVPELAKKIGTSMDTQRWQMERTLRTGLTAASNRAHNANYLTMRKTLPDLQRQGHEYLMAADFAAERRMKRKNHPFSFLLHGVVTDLDKPWQIRSPKFPVMFWTRSGAGYAGMHYPAHLYDRGREVPYRAAWERYLKKTVEVAANPS